LVEDFQFNLHWIPSHIENTSAGRLPIHGNIEADLLAVSARSRSDEKDCINDIRLVRAMVLAESALLINSIDNLLQKMSS